MTTDLEKVMEGLTEDEKIFVATQWQLMWWKFRKHKMAIVAVFLITFL